MRRVEVLALPVAVEPGGEISELTRFSARLTMLELTFEHLGTAIFLLDGQARILDLNARARVALAAGAPLAVREGILTAHDPVDAARLTALIVRCRAADPDKSGPTSLLLSAAHDDAPLRMQVMPLEGRELPLWLDSTRFSRAALLVTVEPVGPSIRSLVRDFGLTPAEAEIALLLCQGKTARDIATRRSTRTGTVHSQIKQIYQKARVAGHPQLIAKLFVVNPPAQ